MCSTVETVGKVDLPYPISRFTLQPVMVILQCIKYPFVRKKTYPIYEFTL